jgi:hypothetical protein
MYTPRLIVFGACSALIAAATAVAGAGASALAGSVCVGNKPACFATIQQAVDAAHEGDTITIGPGTFAGGISIDVSVTLKGAGAASTIISGGTPVLTIGVADAATEPTVAIKGVTVTGGVAVSNPTDPVPARDFGGGIEIPWAADGATGATVTISDSIVTRNRATPTTSVPSGGAQCPGGPCPFARGDGGGIGNFGNLTLIRTTLSNNVAGGLVASDAHGGGIWSAGVGTLTLESSTVTGNDSIVAIPNGRFAIGGGVHIQNGGALTIRNSVVSNNSASLSSLLPRGIGMQANGGGIHVGDDSAVAIDNSTISGNDVTVDDPNGEPAGYDSAIILGQSSLAMRNSTVDNNRTDVLVASTADAGPSGTALEVDGGSTISNTRITNNSTTVTAVAGAADAAGTVFSFPQALEPVLIENSLISDNSVTASATGGPATVNGAALTNQGPLELRNTRIADNSGAATGPAGAAQGGGIWNGALIPFPEGPPVELTLTNSTVTGNLLSGSPGLTIQGGGLFTSFPVALVNSRITNNVPDECFGCD